MGLSRSLVRIQSSRPSLHFCHILLLAACSWYFLRLCIFFFFFNDTATTEIYTNLNTLSLHDALPISSHIQKSRMPSSACDWRSEEHTSELQSPSEISYAVFCLQKKKGIPQTKETVEDVIPYQKLTWKTAL